MSRPDLAHTRTWPASNLESDPNDANPKHLFHINHFHEPQCFAKFTSRWWFYSTLRVWVLTGCESKCHRWGNNGHVDEWIHVGEFWTTRSPPGSRTSEATKSRYLLLNTQRRICSVYAVNKTDYAQLHSHRQRKKTFGLNQLTGLRVIR